MPALRSSSVTYTIKFAEIGAVSKGQNVNKG